MVIFLNLHGTAEKVDPQHVYQGSNNVTDVTVVAPHTSTTAMQIGFILPNGLYWETPDGSRYAPMQFVQQDTVANVCVWHYELRQSVTEQMGDLYIAINAVTAKGNTTSYLCKTIIEESVLPNLPAAPEPSVYELLQLYISRLDGITANVPNLVASIQKVASNAFTYTNNSGVTSARIVLEGADAPIPVNTASTIEIPPEAWQAVTNPAGELLHYAYTITAGLHGQMRDGATAKDLWVNADTADSTDLQGYFPHYTVDESGNIAIQVNQPVGMTVRVWNGKSIADTEARELVAEETARAESAEQQLQTQIDELQNTGVDTTARAAIAAETERAETIENRLQTEIETEATRSQAAEGELRQAIESETSRATSAEGTLSTRISAEVTRATSAEQSIRNDVTAIVETVSFTSSSWFGTSSEMAYLGVFRKTVTVPTGKRIVQVLDNGGQPRGAWRGNAIYANGPFAGTAIIL